MEELFLAIILTERMKQAPAMYDSAGCLYILDRFRRPTQGRWVLLMNTNLLARKVGKEETYWPVGLSMKEFLCIILKVHARLVLHLLVHLTDVRVRVGIHILDFQGRSPNK